MNHWIVKSEPGTYSWADFVKEGKTSWTGVRNFQARNNLRAMQKGDAVLFYHSGDEKQIVGLARVTGQPRPDPTAAAGDWVCVELAPAKPLATPVALTVIKADKSLHEILLVRNSRLSVTPLSGTQFQHLLNLGDTKI